jgi:hypothetical protein
MVKANYMYGQKTNQDLKNAGRTEFYPAREDVPADLWGKPIENDDMAAIVDNMAAAKYMGSEKGPEYRYNEDKFLAEVLEYIETTYAGHYVGKEEIQTTDVWHTLGSADTTTRDTAIKYLMRYGKKDGYNRKDLLKAIHYIVLLAHFTEEKQK